jgi:thiamine-phosphate pyrophosphorylase
LIRCLITDGTYSRVDAGNDARWMAHVAHWIAAGVELVQIRERDLAPHDLAELTRKIMRLPNPHGTKILVNDRADVAIACNAHGVHLRDGSVEPQRFARRGFLVSVSCHRIEDAEKITGASFVLLAPVFKPFSKTDTRPVLGIGAVKEFIRRSPAPVLALGGITDHNAQACLDAGAAGIAGITYFAR